MRILREFASRTQLPVKINEVASAIIAAGFVRRIAFHKFDTPAEEGIGMLILREDLTAYVSDELRAEVAYCGNWPPFLQRLVCAKELLHTCDVDGALAQTKEQVSVLIQEICIPAQALAELRKMKKLTPQGASDHGGWLLALAVLVPRDALKILKDLYDADKLRDEEIAETAEIPVEYVPLIMSDIWSELLNALCPIDA